MRDDIEVRVLGYCEECGNEITDEMNDTYVDGEGRYFCCSECLLESYGVRKIEN